jgi:hypothetical protein
MKLAHLSRAEHEQLASTLSRVQSDLKSLTTIVGRAPFTDEVLRVQKRVQERIIDPLRQVSELPHYPNVGYPIRMGRD